MTAPSTPSAEAGSSTEAGLRRALLGVAALMCLGLIGELLLIEHTQSPVQLVPLALAGLSLLAIGALARRPSRRVNLAARLTALVTGLGSAFGMWEHLEHNYAFEVEIRPSAAFAELAREALFGASPLLAPGALMGVALLLAAATWRHPRG